MNSVPISPVGVSSPPAAPRPHLLPAWSSCFWTGNGGAISFSPRGICLLRAPQALPVIKAWLRYRLAGHLEDLGELVTLRDCRGCLSRSRLPPGVWRKAVCGLIPSVVLPLSESQPLVLFRHPAFGVPVILGDWLVPQVFLSAGSLRPLSALLLHPGTSREAGGHRLPSGVRTGPPRSWPQVPVGVSFGQNRRLLSGLWGSGRG